MFEWQPPQQPLPPRAPCPRCQRRDTLLPIGKVDDPGRIAIWCATFLGGCGKTGPRVTGTMRAAVEAWNEWVGGSK